MANFTAPFGCSTRNCTFVFAPGTGGHLYCEWTAHDLAFFLITHTRATHTHTRATRTRTRTHSRCLCACGLADSSTNFILAGLVLLAHSPPAHRTWDTLDMPALLGFGAQQYNATFFPADGAMNEAGLNTVGVTRCAPESWVGIDCFFWPRDIIYPSCDKETFAFR